MKVLSRILQCMVMAFWNIRMFIVIKDTGKTVIPMEMDRKNIITKENMKAISNKEKRKVKGYIHGTTTKVNMLENSKVV